MSDQDTRRNEAPTPTAKREIRRWETSGGEVAVVELQDYEGGRQVIAIRRWYRDRSGELRPGRAGLSFPLSDLNELESAIGSLRMIVPHPMIGDEDPAEQYADHDVARLEATPPPPRFHFPRLPPRRPEPVAPEVLARIASAEPPMPAPPPATVPSPTPPQPKSTLAEIFAMGLVSAPLGLRLEVGKNMLSGVAYADGSIIFGNRRFANPREAVSILRNQRHVVDAWHALRYRNPKTQRFARLSRLRGLYQSLSEAPDLAASENDS